MSQPIEPTYAFNSLGQASPSSGEPLLPPGYLAANRYRIEALLGEGGMGAVYRALDTELDERVAFKVLRDGSDPAQIERFRREVKLARKVTHPNVARTFDLGACSGFRFLTMELIEGVSLARRAPGTLSLSEALRICTDIARGLAAAHAAGVVHRDLKPDNVLLAGASPDAPLSGTERVVITDFGIARATEREGADEHPESQRSRDLTLGGIVGTPAYMAPEQLVGETPDGRTDVYALGVLLFELLAGRLPFEGDSPINLAMARLAHEAPDIRSICSETPAPVADLIGAMLARERLKRPDATRVLHDLIRLRGEGRGEDRNPVEELTRIPTSTATILREGTLQSIRSVAVLPLTAAEPALESLGRELGAMLADGLARSPTFRVIPPSLSGANLEGLIQIGQVDVALAGNVRAEGERLRVNLRYLDLTRRELRWSERFEGQRSATFALEDALQQAADMALRALAGGEEPRKPGPSDPVARTLYEQARERSHRMSNLPVLEEALAMVRKAHELAPGDAFVMSLLGLVLVRYAIARRDADPALIAEAEDWALRALNTDASLGSTFVALGLVRLHQGELRASVRAFREAISREPRNAEANAYLGRFLVESSFLQEGIRRLEFSLELDPSVEHAWWNLARSQGLLRRWHRVEEILDRAVAATGNAISGNIVRARLVFWRGDREVAAASAEQIAASTPPGHFIRAFLPVIRAYVAGERVEPFVDELRKAGHAVPSPALRAFWCQSEAEILASLGHLEPALDAIERALLLPFVDLGWMDHCPALDRVRATGRFGQARAIVAARAEALWK
ncbi:MAG: protein kinase [Myxococcales bacterium]|nr:protein kinase [Polyangiaceae bacterium]MDW8249402.1 protein kinase [Myxococcales bacterium]